MDHDLDNLIRSHLSSELDAMRGQSARAFAREVTRPMELRLKRNRQWIGLGRQIAHVRSWGPTAMGLAACTAIAVVLPNLLQHDRQRDIAEIAPRLSRGQPGLQPAPFVSSFANYQRTSEFVHFDEGSARTTDGLPVRKLRQQQVEALRYIDPQTKEEYEWVIPSEHRMVVPANRQ